MRKILLLFPILALAASLSLTACKTPRLEPGGAYAPTNEQGVVTYNDVGLAMADASYKFAYDAVLSVLKFEKDNRTKIFAINPTVGLDIKHALDKVRDEVWAVDQKWAAARKSYRSNPTPAGLTTLQTVLAEIERVSTAAQADIVPIATSLSFKPATQ